MENVELSKCVSAEVEPVHWSDIGIRIKIAAGMSDFDPQSISVAVAAVTPIETTTMNNYRALQNHSTVLPGRFSNRSNKKSKTSTRRSECGHLWYHAHIGTNFDHRPLFVDGSLNIICQFQRQCSGWYPWLDVHHGLDGLQTVVCHQGRGIQPNVVCKGSKHLPDRFL